MKFYELYGYPVCVNQSKRQSARDLLISGIEKQLRLLMGDRVENKKGSLIKSWFTSGNFVPMVGNRPLLGKKQVIRVDSGVRRDQILTDFREAVLTGGFDSLLNELDQARSA
jgi:hypothetical protein